MAATCSMPPSRSGCADEVLGRFTDGNGDFSMAYSKDIRGLLSLQSAIDYLEPGLARYVRQSLEHPYHVSLMQYKARHHLSYLQTLPTRCTAMEELALANFKLNKQLPGTRCRNGTSG